MVPTDPDVALANAVQICKGLAPAPRVEVVSTPRDKGPCVLADADRLQQVFINLISNAIRHNTHPEPEVRITSVLREDAYELTVEDNGPGIPAPMRARLFSKFSRGWARTPPGTHGSGLGLAISAQIVNRLGGRLELVTECATGACFRVQLPRAGRADG